MASEFFGLKGNLVKRYQELLNSLGANLKVNGKWNKKTEAAFNQYRDAFLEALGMKTSDENPYAMRSFERRDDETLREEAENAYGGAYDESLETMRRNARNQEASLDEALAAVEPEAEAQRASLSQNHEAQRQTLSDAALSRGLGRSSYVLDQLAGNQMQENQSAASIDSAAAQKRDALQKSIFQSRKDLDESTARVLNEREKRILSAIDESRAADRKAEQDAQAYNNEQVEKYRKEQEQKRQFQQELAMRLRLARMKR